MEEVIVSCVIKHLSLVDGLQSLVNYQYREDHTEEYDLLCKIMAETFKKINAMERQLQVSGSCFSAFLAKQCLMFLNLWQTHRANKCKKIILKMFFPPEKYAKRGPELP